MLGPRLKVRGGGGGKVMAPLKSAPEPNTNLDKRSASAPRRTPISGKENHVSLSVRKGSVPRQRIQSAPDPSNKRAVLVPASGVRWSTSSIPRVGTDSSTPRLVAASIGLLRQSSSRASDSGKPEKSRGSGLPEVRRSSSGIGVLEDRRQRQTGVSRDRLRDVPSHPLRTNSPGRNDPKPTKSEVNERRRLPASGSSIKKNTCAAASAPGIQHSRGRVGVPNKGPAACLDRPPVVKVPEGISNTSGADSHCDEAGSWVADAAGTASADRIAKISGGGNVVQQTDSENGKEQILPAACSNTNAGYNPTNSGDATLISSQGKECSAFNPKGDKPASAAIKSAPERYRKSVDNTTVTVKQTNSDDKPNFEIQGSGKSSRGNHADPGRVIKATSVFENANGTIDQKKLDPVANKFPSKLHEKLAMLEGKVQRIATDIKRTKDMLDSSNPDASKFAISSIQRRISGIEKAVGSMIDGAKTKVPISFTVQKKDLELNKSERGRGCQVNNENHSVNPLSSEQLEGKLFPHQKSLQNPKPSDDLENADCQNQQSNPVIAAQQHFEDRSLNPIDEDPVALEFLASLNYVDSSTDISAVPFIKVDTKTTTSAEGASKDMISLADYRGSVSTANGNVEKFEQEHKDMLLSMEEYDELKSGGVKIGSKSSTGGWFVSDGEAVLLANSDGSCSYFDVANNEKKAEYKPPPGLPNNLWGDCWFIRAPGADGCAGRYIVAASAGNVSESGFCSWDFYKKDINAFRLEEETFPTSLPSLNAHLPNNSMRPSSLCPTLEKCQWWYRPCGYLIASTSTNQNFLKAYDVRDGSLVMTWSVHSPVTSMEYSGPLQWRSRGKVMIAETEAISLWDVNSLNPQPLLSVACVGKKISALHVNNTDAELGGGIRQRVSSSEIDGNDGIFCTEDSFSIFDFRLPSGVGLKISNPGYNVHSVYSRGDLILIGGTEIRSGLNGDSKSVIQSFSVRKGKPVATYTLPRFKTHTHDSAVHQVWGNSGLVMGACGMGLFVFNVPNEGQKQNFKTDQVGPVEARESVGSELYLPSFDYLGERVLLISRDRPASWRYLV